MQFTTLLSGSSGNCIYISGNKTKILVDAGCSMRYLQQSLAKCDCIPEQIAAILITHEHSDHISGAAKISRKYGIPIFASRLTWEKFPFYEEFLPCERHIFEYGMRIGELELDFFRLSHDACQPVGMIIEENGIKLGIITDTGIVTPAMFRKLTNLNALLIEANHNVDMLRKGAYPLFLKKRISGDEGHLSNKQAGEALTQLIGQKTQTIVLAHLSQSNNTPETAYREVMDILNKNGISAGTITVAPRFSPHPLIVL